MTQIYIFSNFQFMPWQHTGSSVGRPWNESRTRPTWILLLSQTPFLKKEESRSVKKSVVLTSQSCLPKPSLKTSKDFIMETKEVVN